MKFLGTDLCGGENAGRRKRDQQNQCFEACFFFPFTFYILWHSMQLNYLLADPVDVQLITAILQKP